MECSKSSSKGQLYSETSLPQKTRKISNKQRNVKGTRKRTKKLQNQDRETNNKDQSINKWSRDWKIIEKFNELKSWFFENINKIDEPWARLTKKRDGPNKTRNERGQVTTDTTEIQRIIYDYKEQLYANKMDNPEVIDKSLEMYNL